MSERNLLPCPFCGGPAGIVMGLPGCEPCALVRRDAASWNARTSAPQASQPPQGASSLLPADKIEAVVERLVAEVWTWGESCGVDGVRMNEQGDSHNEWMRANALKAKDALYELLSASPLPAPQEPAALRIVAKPLNWERMSETEWSDDRGFFIRFDPEDDPDEPYSVAWGEGDAENFKTLDEAKAWCVRKIEGWLNECAYAAPAPQEPALTPAIAVALVADALRRGGDKRLAMAVENLALSLFAAPAPQEPADPMDWPLPCDVKVGNGTHRRGTSLRSLVARMQMLHRVAFGDPPSPEQQARNLAELQGYAAPAPVDPESQGSSEPPSSQGAEAGLQGAASTLTREQIANLIDAAVAAASPISATQPASPARELTDLQISDAIRAAGNYTGYIPAEDIRNARAVIARDRALREQGR